MLKLFCRRFSSTRVLSLVKNGVNRQQFSDIGDEGSSVDEIRELLDKATSGIDMENLSKDDQWLTEPYVHGTFIEPRVQRETEVVRDKMDPENTSIILFPGYGSQFVGMAKSLEIIPQARDIFNHASELMG